MWIMSLPIVFEIPVPLYLSIAISFALACSSWMRRNLLSLLEINLYKGTLRHM